MRIGIDISMLVFEGSGVATYTFNFTKALLQHYPEHEYRLFYSSLRKPESVKSKLKELKSFGAKVHKYPIPPWALKWLWNKHHLLPVEWLIGKVDIYHSSDYLRPPLKKNTKGMTTIHDVTWKVFPDYHTEDIVEAHDRKIEKTIKHKDMIICDSKNTRKDLLKYYPQTMNLKLEVIYLGIDERFKPIKDSKAIKEVLAKYGIEYPKRYLLYVGAIEPRKNLDNAVRTYAKLISDRKYQDVDFLIVGRAGWKNEELFNLIESLDLIEKVKFVGYVEDEDLPYFYNAAKVFIYLSEYEGFGLPPLESLACEIPCICFNNSSLSEIIPNTQLLEVNSNIQDLTKKIKMSISLNKLKIKTPSWNTYAEKFMQVISDMI